MITLQHGHALIHILHQRKCEADPGVDHELFAVGTAGVAGPFSVIAHSGVGCAVGHPLPELQLTLTVVEEGRRAGSPDGA